MQQPISIFGFYALCLVALFSEQVFSIALPPIARWNAIPFETCESHLAPGILAFHSSGIEKVEFRFGTNKTTTIRRLSYNPSSRTVEYWFSLDCRNLEDGPFSLSATVFSKDGQTLALPSLPLFSNTKTTASSYSVYVSGAWEGETENGTPHYPFKSIRKALAYIGLHQNGNVDGGIINLMPGDYTLDVDTDEPKTIHRWLTLRSAPNAPKGSVRIVNSSDVGLRTKLVKLESLTVAPGISRYAVGNGVPLMAGALNTHDALEDYLWANRVEFVGPGRHIVGKWLPYGGTTPSRDIMSTWTGAYITNSSLRSSSGGFETATLVRNSSVTDIGSDALSNSLMVVNVNVSNIDHRGTLTACDWQPTPQNPCPTDGFHPDVYQFYGAQKNIILYNINATDNIRGQGVFAGWNINLENVVLANLNVDNAIAANGVGNVFQFGGSLKNFLVIASQFKGPNNWITANENGGGPSDGARVIDTAIVKNSLFEPELEYLPGLQIINE